MSTHKITFVARESRAQKTAKADSTAAARAIHKLGQILDGDDPKAAADAREYLIGLAKCLDFECNGRGVATVKAYPMYNPHNQPHAGQK